MGQHWTIQHKSCPSSKRSTFKYLKREEWKNKYKGANNEKAKRKQKQVWVNQGQILIFSNSEYSAGNSSLLHP